MPEGLRVLIVEDEGLLAMLLQDMLEELGHAVAGAAATLAKAQELAASVAFDVAIVDVNLGGERTYPLAESLRARGVPFVFASGYGASGLAAEWRSAPMLQKPYQTGDLAVAIAKAMGQP